MTMKFKALLVACVILGLLTEPLGAQNSATERVIGGHSPTLAWPYAASIIIDGSLLCGGTLVAPKFVLTAAHCTTDERTLQVRKSFEIRLGSSSRESGGEVFHAIRVITHENFGKPHRLENDIALLELDRSADIQPVQLEGLPASSGRSVSIDNESRAIPFAKIVGWGRTNPDPSVSSASETLIEADIPIVDNTACQRSWTGDPSIGSIDQRRICAGQSEGGVDSCSGDSGGPLLSKSADGQWAEVGLVSFGTERCAKAGVYGVYTRVSAFHDWLARNLSIEQGHTPPVAVPTSPITSASTIVAAAGKEDGRVRVTIGPDRNMMVGDEFRISVSSVFDGYLLLLDLDNEGKITQLFPNPRSELGNADGRILAETPLTLPDANYGQGFKFTASEPFGRGRVIAVVSTTRSGIEDLLRAQDGFASVGSSHLASLDFVLKQRPQISSSTTVPPSDGWAAGQIDYIVSAGH